MWRKYQDGEIAGLDNDGCVIQWDGYKGELYNCGETPDQFGVSLMSAVERARCGLE